MRSDHSTRKTVTIGIKMDSTFVRLLNTSVELAHLKEKDELTPIQQIALIALLEARGATEIQTHAAILQAWRPHVEAISALRYVEVEENHDGSC